MLPYEDLTRQVIGAAIEVHSQLGPGFLEAIYQRAMEKELAARSIHFSPQDPVPVMYKGESMGTLRPDFLVDGKLIVEIKAVPSFLSQHTAKAIHYLSATGMRLALLINFGTDRLSVKRVIL